MGVAAAGAAGRPPPAYLGQRVERAPRSWQQTSHPATFIRCSSGVAAAGVMAGPLQVAEAMVAAELPRPSSPPDEH